MRRCTVLQAVLTAIVVVGVLCTAFGFGVWLPALYARDAAQRSATPHTTTTTTSTTTTTTTTTTRSDSALLSPALRKLDSRRTATNVPASLPPSAPSIALPSSPTPQPTPQSQSPLNTAHDRTQTHSSPASASAPAPVPAQQPYPGLLLSGAISAGARAESGARVLITVKTTNDPPHRERANVCRCLCKQLLRLPGLWV
jgi:hypothetical protein